MAGATGPAPRPPRSPAAPANGAAAGTGLRLPALCSPNSRRKRARPGVRRRPAVRIAGAKQQHEPAATGTAAEAAGLAADAAARRSARRRRMWIILGVAAVLLIS